MLKATLSIWYFFGRRKKSPKIAYCLRKHTIRSVKSRSCSFCEDISFFVLELADRTVCYFSGRLKIGHLSTRCFFSSCRIEIKFLKMKFHRLNTQNFLWLLRSFFHLQDPVSIYNIWEIFSNSSWSLFHLQDSVSTYPIIFSNTTAHTLDC